MTTAELQNAEARYQRAFRVAEAERKTRNATVRQALAEGWTHAKIAEATGLTRGRIGQIATTVEQALAGELEGDEPSGGSATPAEQSATRRHAANCKCPVCSS